MTEEHDKQGGDDETGDLPGRNLGAGHPLSADADRSEQPPPSDIDADLPADDEDAGPTSVTDTDEPPAGGAQRSGKSGVSRRSLLLGGAAGAVGGENGPIELAAEVGADGRVRKEFLDQPAPAAGLFRPDDVVVSRSGVGVVEYRVSAQKSA